MSKLKYALSKLFFGADEETKQTALFDQYNSRANEIKAEINAAGLGNQMAFGPSTGIESFLDGDKFIGGFGSTKVYTPDYWTLRARSNQLFHDNLYARGLIRRLVTNEINVGLTLEAVPNPSILGMDDEQLNDWADGVEDRFDIWGKNKKLVDYLGENTFGNLQRIARTQSIISGDILVYLRFDTKLNLPKIQLIDGGAVRTPMDAKPRAGHSIKHGVELDASGRQVAYFIKQKNGKSKRVPAFGEKSGRRLAWLMYGSDRLVGDVRGMPLLGLIMQSLRELDRYRDAELRAAVVNSMVAAWVKKEADKPGTTPFSGGAMRKDTIQTGADISQTSQGRAFELASQIPGVVIDELQTGESPQSFDTSRPNVNFGAFESAIAHALAWANEVPPEIYLLAFNNNYSASRAAVNEFKLYLNKQRSIFADDFCQPVYEQWLVAEVLARRIAAPGLIEGWRDPLQYDIWGAWISSDWGGAIKPSVDLKKEVQGYEQMNSQGWITNDRATKELTGQKFSKNIQRLKREEKAKTELMIEKMRPILELQKEFGAEAVNAAMQKFGITAFAENENDDTVDNIIDFLEQNAG